MYLCQLSLADLLTLESMSDGTVQSNVHSLVCIHYFARWPAHTHTNNFDRSECADRNLPPSPPIHRSQSGPQTEGWRTSLGEVFL